MRSLVEPPGFMNSGGSTKDRIANHILTKAYRSGAIQPGGTVVEASSGSTSIAMAMVCAQLGLKFIAVMPAGVSNERSLIIKAYGGAVHHTDEAATMAALQHRLLEREVYFSGYGMGCMSLATTDADIEHFLVGVSDAAPLCGR